MIHQYSFTLCLVLQWFKRKKALTNLAEEIQQHLDEAAAELIHSGMSPKDAWLAARKQFGSPLLARERSRDVRGWRFWEALAFDLRCAVRQLRKSPAFAVAVVLTLALAIGANTAIFSVVNAVLLQPLPYPNPSRLLCVWHGDTQSYSWYTFSFPRFAYFQQNLQGIADIAAYDDEVVTLKGSATPLRVEGGRVSANFFSLLGVQPQFGRTFLPAEDRHGADSVVLLSDRLWRQSFKADRTILGRTLSIDGEDSTIIGVLPGNFQFTDADVDVWRTRMIDTRTFAPTSVQLGASYLTVIARLHPKASLPQFQAQLKTLNSQYVRRNPGNSDIVGPITAAPLQDKIFARVHVMLLVLWGAVICLLVIACANVANLILARATSRYRDISVRFALGASRGRIALQLIAENLLLSLGSVFVSLPLTLWGMRLLVFALGQNSSVVPHVALDIRVMLFTFGMAAAIGLLLGLTPLWMIGDSHAAGRGISASRTSAGLRNTIVVAQFALCLVLLAGSGLLTESFLRMSTMNTGLHTNQVSMTSLDLMPDRYENWPKRVSFYNGVLRAVETIPGVTEAAVASRVDLLGSGLGYLIQVDGQPDLGARNPSASGRSVSASYFGILGIPILRGRVFTESDTPLSARVAVVNQAFARRFFPGVSPIGRHVTYSTDRINCEIVGVVGDVRSGLQELGAEEELYLPLAQRPWLVAKLLVRTSVPEGLAASIRNRIQAVDPDQAVAESLPVERIISEDLRRPRTAMFAVSLFAGSALLLTSIGIYGVLAYSVAQRQKEIGIRMALGASGHAVQAMIFRQTSRLLAAGLLVGLPLALLLNRFYAALLFAVSPTDPAVFAAVIGLLLAVGFTATSLPAIRAGRTNPVIILRLD